MFINPYESIQVETPCLRTNFHLHAGLDGDLDLEQVVLSYKEAEYDVLTITNQYTMTDTQALEKKLDMTLINGFEYVDNKDILVIDINNYFEGNKQNVIDECNRQHGFSILAHPNFMKKGWWSLDMMRELKGYTGIEIFNGVIFRMSGSGLATDAWDYMLSEGRLLWGFANDDFHRWFDMAKGWNMIYSKSKKHMDIKEAVLRGRFYATTGLWLSEFNFDGQNVAVKAHAKDTYVDLYRYRFIGQNGEILKETESDIGKYTLTGEEKYVRVEVSSKHGAMLWTQPIYNSKYIRCDYVK